MEYQTPRATIFLNRKRFHATQKSITESISDWFKRLQEFVNNCEFKQIADYMLIDKFISGLSETDFEKISKVPIWTVDELILVVIGNAHIFTCKEVKKKRQCKEDVQLADPSSDETGKIQRLGSGNEVLQFKVEKVVENADANHELRNSFHRLSGGSETQSDADKIQKVNSHPEESSLCRTNKPKKIPLTPSQKSRNYITRLKFTGKYEDYKRTKAQLAKQSRLKAKHNELYLPSELQLHILKERRRATRERVVRCRERKRQNQSVVGDTFLTEPKPDPEVECESDPMRECRTEHDMKREFQPETEVKLTIEPEYKIELGTKRFTGIGRVKKKVKKTKSKPSEIRKKNFECYLCSLKCSNLHDLKTHLNIFHRSEKPTELKCTLCTKTSTSRAVLSRHLRKVHGEYRVLKCPCCDIDFKKRLDLDLHVAQTHPDYRPFICETCGKSYKRSSELKSHNYVHTGQKIYKCEICNQTLASRGGYRNHKSIHTGIRPYPCDLCGKAFRQLSCLSKHLICVHRQGEKPYPCDICSKRFSSSYHLKLHFNSHTGSRPFQCNTCGNAFTQPSSLKLHIRRVHEKNS
ncbi:Zinc finger protein [Pseudolycoriella hygida]|uniref:Zinc finger protein n=1 Tax=Pseudolycoriella hygida TaxID=35572 RepID=A0A9Q0NG68_9DIPT|nr:Zinc finger protein [Pseudolycoriella hygida]